MNEQPGDLLDEAVKLIETLRRRWTGAGRVPGTGEPADAGADRADRTDRAGDDADDAAGGDVWSRAVAEVEAAGRDREKEPPPRIATGAPECRDCPICRAIAAGRESGTDVEAHLREAGRSLLAAARDLATAFERTRGPRASDPRGGPGGAGDHGPVDDG